MTFNLGFDQQGRNSLADLRKSALQQRNGFLRDGVGAAVAFECADGVEHAAQRVVDFVRDAGCQSADRRHALALDHFLFELGLVLQLGEHLLVGQKQQSDLIAVGIQGGVQRHALRVADVADAIGDLLQRTHHAPAPIGRDGQQDRQHQQRDPQGPVHQAREAVPEQGFAVGDDQGTQAHAVVGDRNGNKNDSLNRRSAHKDTGIRRQRQLFAQGLVLRAQLGQFTEHRMFIRA